MIFTRWPCLRTSRMTACTRSLTWCVSPGICSLRGRIASVLPRVTMAVPPSTRVDRAVDQVALLAGEFVEDRVATRPRGSSGSSPAWRSGRRCGRASRGRVRSRRCGRDVPGGRVDGDEHAFLDAEVPFGGELDGGVDAARRSSRAGSSAPRASCPRVREWPCPGSLSFFAVVIAVASHLFPKRRHRPGVRATPGSRVDSRATRFWAARRIVSRHPDAAARSRCIDGSWFYQAYCDRPIAGKQGRGRENGL